jgi:hypothetical protein
MATLRHCESYNKRSRTGGVGIWAADTDLDRGGRTTLDASSSAGGAASWASPSATNCNMESHSFASIFIGYRITKEQQVRDRGWEVMEEERVRKTEPRVDELI